MGSMRMITIGMEGPLGIFDEDVVALDIKEGVLAGKIASDGSRGMISEQLTSASSDPPCLL